MSQDEKPELSIEAVSKSIQNAKIESFFKKYWLLLIAIILLIIIGVAGFQYYQHRQLKKAIAASKILYKSKPYLASKNFDEAIKLYESIQKNSTVGYNTIGYFAKAKVYISKNESAKAKEQLTLAYKDTSIPNKYRYMAIIYSAIIDLNDNNPASARTSLNNVLKNDKNPFYLLAMELSGIASYQQKEYNQAYITFSKILENKEVSLTQKERVTELLISTSGYIRT